MSETTAIRRKGLLSEMWDEFESLYPNFLSKL